MPGRRIQQLAVWLFAIGVGVALAVAFTSERAHAASSRDTAIGGLTGQLTAPVVPIVAPVLDAVDPVVAPVIAPVAPILEPVVEPMAPILTPVLSPVAPVLQPLLDPVVPILGPVLDPLTPVLGPIVQPVLGPIVGALPPPLDGLLGSAPGVPGGAGSAPGTGPNPGPGLGAEPGLSPNPSRNPSPNPALAVPPSSGAAVESAAPLAETRGLPSQSTVLRGRLAHGSSSSPSLLDDGGTGPSRPPSAPLPAGGNTSAARSASGSGDHGATDRLFATLAAVGAIALAYWFMTRGRAAPIAGWRPLALARPG